MELTSTNKPMIFTHTTCLAAPFWGVNERVSRPLYGFGTTPSRNHPVHFVGWWWWVVGS